MAIETPLKGFVGESIKRKEDDRFIRGKGNYVDDITLPGMLHMAILRSPFAHARIRSIDASAAQALPGVVAVVTGELLAQHKLAWMPTLSGDTQAVLATDKVRFQGQEVACVIATDPYVARDALPLIEVDYEVLPAVVDPHKALPPDAVRDRGRPSGTEHPDHLAGYRRRLWQQGADLPRVRRGDGGFTAHRQAGEVGRRPKREPDLHRLRPRLPHEGRDGCPQRRA